MHINEALIEASIYAEAGNGRLYAKISFPDIGLHINSIVVSKSIKYEGELWVQPPAVPYKGKFIKPVEPETNGVFWPIVVDAVMRAVEEYNQNQKVLPL